MKRLIFTLLVCALMATPAIGTPSLGWWQEEHPRATHQLWDFTNAVVDGGTIYEYEADPESKDNPGTSHAWIGDADTLVKDYSIYDPATGSFYDDTAIQVQLKIDDFPDPLAYKDIWVALGFTGNLTNLSVDGTGLSGPYVSMNLPGPGPDPDASWPDADFGFRIWPNPEEETIWITIESYSYVDTGGQLQFVPATLDWIHVDTICIPAPGAIILGSLGVGLVGWLRRRKSL